LTDVVETHSEVEHCVCDICTDGEKLSDPKFIPITVTDSPAEVGWLYAFKNDNTGVSKVKVCCFVPTIAAIVTSADRFSPEPCPMTFRA
jgi:hypothetical protein